MSVSKTHRSLKAGRKGNKSFIPYPKGRPAPSEQDLTDLQLVIGTRKPVRSMLIEYLHVIQDHDQALRHHRLVALSRWLKIPLAEVFEVATFYAHFDVVDDDAPVAPITIRVCDSLTCAMFGAEKILRDLKNKVDPKNIRVVSAPCMGRCDRAPVAVVGQCHYDRVDIDTLVEAAAQRPTVKTCQTKIFEQYCAQGGYQVLQQCYAGKRRVEEVLKALEDSGLRGLGGAGFPTGTKWKFVRQEIGPRLMTVNADEGEPGTFKDRYFMEKDIHRMLEGMLIGAWAVEAAEVYIYLRDEYPFIQAMLEQELPKLRQAPWFAPVTIHLRRGAGAYICGEESAMLESIEGKRGLPRHRPPYISVKGLFGRPTLNNNVETLYWVPDILAKGPQWFAQQGRRDCKGPHSYSVSGRVRDPGVKVAPAGITMDELLEEYCGGMLDGHRFKGYLPGGASGGILPASMADIPLDFGKLEPYGCFIGSGAVIVLSDQDDMRQVVLNLMRFFEDESCGQCTPCRVGTQKAVALLENKHWDIALLEELVVVMRDASICGLGQAAGNPLDSVLKYFAQDCT